MRLTYVSQSDTEIFSFRRAHRADFTEAGAMIGFVERLSDFFIFMRTIRLWSQLLLFFFIVPLWAGAGEASFSEMSVSACRKGAAASCRAIEEAAVRVLGGSDSFSENTDVVRALCRPSVCTDLGFLFLNGQGVQQSYGKSAYFFSSACRQKDGTGCLYLGYLYEGGLGVEASEMRAGENYAASCSRDHPLGCYSLGLLYRSGKGVPQSSEHSAYYFRKACRLGDASGCFMAGLYLDEKGGGENAREAARLYTEACSQKQFEACQNLGFLYENGKGVKKSYEAAARLYTEACAREFAFACYRLGNMYSAGTGVPQSSGEGAYLKSLACRLGESRACPGSDTERAQKREGSGRTRYGRLSLVLP
jgi:hypothetical protein